MPSRVAGLIGLVCVSLASVIAAQSPQTPTSQPTFRGGVDIVTLDVTVLDGARRPVRGLTAADFTLLENGKRQPIVAFAPVDIPDVVTEDAPWTREVAPDVASNAFEQRRLIVILMDDADGSFDPGIAKFAKKIANDVVDQLGPADLAAVAFTFQGRTQTFTSDRDQLHAAVNSYVPRRVVVNGQINPIIPCLLKKYEGGCGIDALEHVAEALKTAPPGRKLLVYISDAAIPNADGTLTDLDALAPLGQMLRSMQLANIAIYSFGPEGLTAAKDPAEGSLRMLAENTGGRATVSTNEPWRGVPDVFRENSSYYLLGFQSTAPANDQRLRHIAVQVNRPGVEVRARSGYYPPKPEKATKTKGAPPSPADLAISKAMPTGDLPLVVATAAFAVPGRKTAELAVIAGVRDDVGEGGGGAAGAGSTRRISVVATAFDSAWRSKGAATETVELSLRPDARGEVDYDVVSRLPLAPGRYEIRLAANTAGRTGSVFLDLDVPDFAKAPLSLSGLVLSRTPAGPVAPANALAGLAPVVPTARRTFAPDDRVSAFVRAYQGASAVLGTVTMTVRVKNVRDEPVFEQTATLEAARFSGTRAADYLVDLPLARLPPGEYLVTIEAARSQATTHRAVRITVR